MSPRRQQPQYYPPPRPTTVRTYTNTKDFQRDQKHMARMGWQVVYMMEHQPRLGMRRFVFGPFALTPKPQIVVTYQR